MIRTMQFGANVSDREMERIAAFLGHPDRPLFEVKCTRCHDMNRIQQARLERKKDAALKALVERMRTMDKSMDIRERCRGDISVFNFHLLMLGTGQQKNSEN